MEWKWRPGEEELEGIELEGSGTGGDEELEELEWIGRGGEQDLEELELEWSGSRRGRIGGNGERG